MLKKITLLSLFIFSLFTTEAQVIFQEDFEAGGLPSGWTIETRATDGGWSVGTTQMLSSDNFEVFSNGSSNAIGSNDDDCNCDKSNDLLMTPAIDLTDQTAVILSYDVLYTDDSYQGAQEDATVEVSINGGASWKVIDDISGDANWVSHGLLLNDYVGEPSVTIGFRYNDGGGWLYGIALDNVVLQVPVDLDANLLNVNERIYGDAAKVNPIKGTIRNEGGNTITSLELSYTINNSTPVTEVIDNISIATFETYSFELTSWIPTSTGVYDINVTVDEINGSMDEDGSNNSASYATEIFPEVNVPNKIQQFVDAVNPVVTEITGASFALNGPTDLDFFPILGRDQLWVVNEETEDSGGSTLMISNATNGPTNFDSRTDGNAWHFMSLPTGIAFSDDNFNFATSPGVQDANHSGGTFTGPTLWSSDLDIYAMPSGGNGSHLDMLHGSPMSMGIAHEVDNVFWIFDDWNGDIVRYDFVDDHGPGNAYHGDALVRRFRNLGIQADGDIPNHMILDKATGWLYIVDNGNDRILRLDINSGTNINAIPLINEALTEHSEVTGFTAEVIINTGLEQACGIEIFENRLLISDYANGNIKVYDMDNSFSELGTIVTGSAGITGIKIGPDGNIWYTNKIENTVNKAEPGEVSNTLETSNVISLDVEPNPTNGLLNVNISGVGNNVNIQLNDITGKLLLNMPLTNNANNIQLDMSGFQNGIYLLVAEGENFSKTERIVLSK